MVVLTQSRGEGDDRLAVIRFCLEGFGEAFEGLVRWSGMRVCPS
jgi:hypothetical protein